MIDHLCLDLDSFERARLPCQINSTDAFESTRWKQCNYGYIIVSGTDMERKRGEVECLIVDQNWKIASKRTFLFSRKMILHTPVVFKEKWGKERQRERDRDRQRERERETETDRERTRTRKLYFTRTVV